MGLFGFGKKKYGEPVVIVSGLPRSGTSMMMKMLEAGGLAVMTDKVREADDDNPKGYYEDERVKDLEANKDRSWVAESRGKVLKVISFLLKDLPADNKYLVVFMRRHLDEVLASQNKMLVNRGEDNATEDAKMKDNYEKHLLHVKTMVKVKDNFEMLEVNHRDAIDDPVKVAASVNAFLGGSLDETAMAGVVDKKLHRNRQEDLAGQAS